MLYFGDPQEKKIGYLKKGQRNQLRGPLGCWPLNLHPKSGPGSANEIKFPTSLKCFGPEEFLLSPHPPSCPITSYDTPSPRGIISSRKTRSKPLAVNCGLVYANITRLYSRIIICSGNFAASTPVRHFNIRVEKLYTKQDDTLLFNPPVNHCESLSGQRCGHNFIMTIFYFFTIP